MAMGTEKLRTSAHACTPSVGTGFLECTKGGTVSSICLDWEDCSAAAARSPSSVGVAPCGAWTNPKLGNCLLKPSPPKNAWLLSGCLSGFGFPKGWKACHPKHFPMPLPWSELMRPGLYLKALFSSIVCLSQGVGGEEGEALSPRVVYTG